MMERLRDALAHRHARLLFTEALADEVVECVTGAARRSELPILVGVEVADAETLSLLERRAEEAPLAVVRRAVPETNLDELIDAGDVLSVDLLGPRGDISTDGLELYAALAARIESAAAPVALEALAVHGDGTLALSALRERGLPRPFLLAVSEPLAGQPPEGTFLRAVARSPFAPREAGPGLDVVDVTPEAARDHVEAFLALCMRTRSVMIQGELLEAAHDTRRWAEFLPRDVIATDDDRARLAAPTLLGTERFRSWHDRLGARCLAQGIDLVEALQASQRARFEANTVRAACGELADFPVTF